jgi:hypothetical protein
VDDDLPLPAGATVGRYVIEALLGAGGMGLVYRATDPALRRPVALKLLRRAYALRLASRVRFAREGQALARISHPHIATVFDVGDDGELCYLALELLDGGTLRRWLATPRRWREVERMFTAIAHGLAAAHARGIIHRDVKPDNVLLTGDGVPRLSDFGVAGLAAADGPPIVASTMTVGGAVIGTPAYMAPEQRAGAPVDARADQYSLCLAWLEALGRDRDAAPNDVGDARGPRWLIEILLRGLAAEPEGRWPSVAALLAAIRRRRRARIGGAVVIGAMAIAATLALWPWSDRPLEAAPATMAPRPTEAIDASVAASPPPPVVLHRDRVGEGHARRLLTGDGGSWVVSSAARDALWLEDRATGARTRLALPEGRLARRSDAIAATSADGAVVVVRMEDLSVWRTGRGLTVPVRLHEHGNGPVCLDATGARVAVSENQPDAPIDIRATDDGRLLGQTEPGHLCAWAGERLVLGWRDDPDHEVHLRLVELAGGGRPLPTLPGELSALAVVDDWVVVAHEVESHPGPIGVMTALSLVDGRTLPLLAPGRHKLGPLTVTEEGLYVGRLVEERGYWLGYLAEASPWIAFRPVLGELQLGGEWLDAASLAIGDGRRVVRHDATGGTRTPLVADRGSVLGVVDDGVITMVREASVPGQCVLHLVQAGRPARALASGRCLDLSLRCDGVRRCALGERDGDDLVFRDLDPKTGVRGAFALRLSRSHTPHVAIAPDGRWLVEDAGHVELVEPRTGTRTALRTDLDRIDDLSWGHDGRYAIVFGWHDGDVAVARLELAGAGPTKTVILARSQASGFSAPRVSPDGKRLLAMKVERPLEYLLVPPPHRSGDTTARATP